jgi:hypothetical protein
MVTGTIIGFVGFVANLLKQTNRWLHGQRPKKSYFSSACEYVKLPFSLKVPKKVFRLEQMPLYGPFRSIKFNFCSFKEITKIKSLGIP